MEIFLPILAWHFHSCLHAEFFKMCKISILILVVHKKIAPIWNPFRVNILWLSIIFWTVNYIIILYNVGSSCSASTLSLYNTVSYQMPFSVGTSTDLSKDLPYKDRKGIETLSPGSTPKSWNCLRPFQVRSSAASIISQEPTKDSPNGDFVPLSLLFLIDALRLSLEISARIGLVVLSVYLVGI